MYNVFSVDILNMTQFYLMVFIFLAVIILLTIAGSVKHESFADVGKCKPKNVSNTYGVGNYDSNSMRVFAPDTKGSNVKLAFRKRDGTFQDALTLLNNGESNTINMKGDTIVNGSLKSNVLHLGDKFRLSGVGDAHANDGWLRLFNKENTGYYGGLAAGELWTGKGALSGSDRRMKENIEDISSDEMSKLNELVPKKYNYKNDNKKSYGFIAQDVEKVYPNLVSEGPNGMKALDYTGFIPLVVENVQDLRKSIPNNHQICIDDVCLTKQDIVKIKQLK